MENIIIVTILLLIISSASAYIIKAKKSGKKCIGCPDGCSCSLDEHSNCSGCQNEK